MDDAVTPDPQSADLIAGDDLGNGAVDEAVDAARDRARESGEERAELGKPSVRQLGRNVVGQELYIDLLADSSADPVGKRVSHGRLVDQRGHVRHVTVCV